MKLRLGRKQRVSIDDIEREAAAEIERRVSMGRPPTAEWAGVAELQMPDVGAARRSAGLTSSSSPEVSADTAAAVTAADDEALEGADGVHGPEPTDAVTPAPPARKATPRKAAPPKATKGATKATAGKAGTGTAKSAEAPTATTAKRRTPSSKGTARAAKATTRRASTASTATRRTS